MTPTQYLRKVISNYELGVITDRELPGAVFRGLTTENLRELLTFASPKVLATLRDSAAAALRGCFRTVAHNVSTA